MKRVAIIGATVHGNHGAEAMLATTIGRLRERIGDVRFDVFSYYPERDRALVTDPSVTVHSSTPSALVLVLFPFALLLSILKLVGLGRLAGAMPSQIAALAKCDMLVDLAGVSFVDGREKFLPFNILTILPAMLLKVPVVKFAQAVGPFRNPVNRLAANLFLRRCDHVFGRGDQTMAHLTAIRFPADRHSRAADIAFLLKDADALHRAPHAEMESHLSRLDSLKSRTGFLIGICPSAVMFKKEGEPYLARLVELVRKRVAQGDAVLIFPNATRADDKVKLFNNDIPLITRMLGMLAECAVDRTLILAVESDVYAADIKTLIARCDLVVVSRFHAMVGALADAVPPLVIGWSHKYAEVMNDFEIGTELYAFDVAHDADLDLAVHDLKGRLDSVREAIAARKPAISALASRQVDYAVARLG